jgi:hypothetical protein
VAAAGTCGSPFRSARVWRLVMLFLAVVSVPLILGSWLVHYLDVDEGWRPRQPAR